MSLAEYAALFPAKKNLIYFNHAAVGALSTRAYEAMEQHARDQREHGALHWKDWYAEYDRYRDAAARLIGAKPGEIAILKNTSEGLSFVAQGLRWRAGDNVVTTDMEFPSNSTPWRRLDSRGVECRIVQTKGGTFTPAGVEALIDERTRLVSVSFVAFHNGFAADLDAIGEICARHGVLFCVDGIQGVGVLPLDVHRSKIHFLAADSHKWMCGPEGAAIFFVAEEILDELEVLESGWTNFIRKGTFIDCPLDLVSGARRFEAGSLNTNGVYGARAAVELLLEAGIETVSERVIALTNRLADGLESIGWRLGAPRPIRSGIVGVTPPDVENSLLRWHRLLEEKGVICAPREGMLRFSPHFYNDEAEVDRVIELLRD